MICAPSHLLLLVGESCEAILPAHGARLCVGEIAVAPLPRLAAAPDGHVGLERWQRLRWAGVQLGRHIDVTCGPLAATEEERNMCGGGSRVKAVGGAVRNKASPRGRRRSGTARRDTHRNTACSCHGASGEPSRRKATRGGRVRAPARPPRGGRPPKPPRCASSSPVPPLPTKKIPLSVGHVVYPPV